MSGSFTTTFLDNGSAAVDNAGNGSFTITFSDDGTSTVAFLDDSFRFLETPRPLVVQQAGTAISTRGTINFVSGATVADNVGSTRADITITAAISDGDKGDVTVTASGATWTIDAGVVTLAKMADLAQDQFIIRTTASTGVPQTATMTAAGRAMAAAATAAAQVALLPVATTSAAGTLSAADKLLLDESMALSLGVGRYSFM